MTAKTLRKALVTTVDRKSYLMTGDAPVYVTIGKEFSGHGAVVHSKGEYVRKVFYYTNTVESYFAIVKRGIYGNFHSVSEGHLNRYLAEFDFKYKTPKLSKLSEVICF